MATRKATSNETPRQSQLFQPDPDHLASLKVEAEGWYDGNVSNEWCEVRKGYFPGSMERFFQPSLSQALEFYVEKHAEGYRLSNYVPDFAPGAGCSIVLVKPEALQQAELSKLYANIEADYQAKLEKDRAVELERQVEMLYAAEVRKTEAARLDAERKAKDAHRAAVLAGWGMPA